MKDTAAFSEKVALAGEPIIVTKNDYEKFIVVDAEPFKQYRLETSEKHLERMLADADRDIRAGRTSNARANLESMRRQHGL